MFEASLGRCYPMGASKRRIVADVLLMSTFKLGNPIEIVIQMKVNDFSHGPSYSCLHRFHGAPVVSIEHDRSHCAENIGCSGEQVGGFTDYV